MIPGRTTGRRPQRGRRIAGVVVAAVLSSAPMAAQPPETVDGSGPEVTTAGVPVAQATRTERAPTLDGEVVGEALWSVATPATGFRQNTPDEGEPASERTEVRILYDDDTLYIGVVCYVRDPSTILISETRRDSSLADTDSFQIILDTYSDNQTGFVFGTNPTGLEYDGQVTNEGQGSGQGGLGLVRRSGSQQQRGSGGGFNLNWDGAWDVRARVSEIGWSAEMAIPFRTLRYPGGETQTWGVNFQRNVRSRNERSFWAPLPRQFDLNRLSLAGELRGLRVPAQRNLKLTPYVLGDTIRRDVDSRTTTVGDVGADLKYSVTPSLTLDLTYNTDFAQVEVDDQQVNLDRFNLFFPEKRPFFLENAGLFSVGQPGQLEVFFSRRIGIGAEGEQIPIVGGGRLSGKAGANLNVGLLSMQTESLAARGTPTTNYTVARVRQDFQNRSNVGAMFVNRVGTGSFADDHDSNQTYAVDGRLGVGPRGTISGFAAETQTAGGRRQDTHAFNVSADHDSERYRFGGGFTEVGPHFNPEVGFYARRGYRRVDGAFRTAFRPENSWGIHELTPHVSFFTVWSYETGQKETEWVHVDHTMEWRNGLWVSAAVNLTTEGVLQPFEIDPGVIVPVDRYDHTEAQLRIRTDRGSPVSVELFSVFGGFFGGKRAQIRPHVNLRLGETFSTQVAWERNDIEVPGGAFITNLASLRLNYSFTTRMFVQALMQYNDRAELWSSNLRFGLVSAANTGLFIVYNETEGIRRFVPAGAGRSLTLKYSHLFDLLN